MALSRAQMAEYLKGLAAEKKFDEAKSGKLVSLVEGDGDITMTRAELAELLEPIVELPLGRHAAFSQKMNEVEGKSKKLDKWYQETALPAVQQASATATEAREKLMKYVSRYGDLDEAENLGDGRTRTATGETVSTEQLKKLIADARAESEHNTYKQVLSFQLDEDRIRREHFGKFKELIELDKLVDIVAKGAEDGKQITLQDAYKHVYGEKVEAYDQAQYKATIDAEVQKQLKAERARRPAPSNGAGTPESGAFFAHHVKSQKEEVAPASDIENENAFTQDFTSELDKRGITLDQ